jgi:3-oxoacyl-[acyl-carrier-protein] synthase III
VPVLGFGHGQTSFEVAQRATLTSTEAVRAAETAFRMAGATPQDVDWRSCTTASPSPC